MNTNTHNIIHNNTNLRTQTHMQTQIPAHTQTHLQKDMHRHTRVVPYAHTCTRTRTHKHPHTAITRSIISDGLQRLTKGSPVHGPESQQPITTATEQRCLRSAKISDAACSFRRSPGRVPLPHSFPPFHGLRSICSLAVQSLLSSFLLVCSQDLPPLLSPSSTAGDVGILHTQTDPRACVHAALQSWRCAQADRAFSDGGGNTQPGWSLIGSL